MSTTTTDLTHLATLLDAFCASTEVPDLEEGEERFLSGKEVQSIVTAATDILIDEGEPQFGLIDDLYHLHGYFVYPGERDRFGWLTACIQTKKGDIVFG